MKLGRASLAIAIAMCCAIFSCKKEVYDPANYEDLLYKYEAPPAPVKEYIFKANVGGTSWDTKGSAFVSEDTMTISGTVNGETLLLQFAGFRTLMSFTIGHQSDSAALSLEGATEFKYASIGKSHGKITILKNDLLNNQIEGNFDMVLYSTGGDSTAITAGYFKINYSANRVSYVESAFFESIQMDSVSGTENTDYYTIYSKDTVAGRVLVMVIPKNLGNYSYGQPIPIGKLNGLPTAYYTDPFLAQYGLGDSTQATIAKGDLTIVSNVNNVIKGRFQNLDFRTTTGDDLITLSDGTFSAEY